MADPYPITQVDLQRLSRSSSPTFAACSSVGTGDKTRERSLGAWRERERGERERVREGERVALRRRHWIGDNDESNGHKFFGTACRRNREGLSMTKGPTWKWYRND